jgi:hypothetical protein
VSGLCGRSLSSCWSLSSGFCHGSEDSHESACPFFAPLDICIWLVAEKTIGNQGFMTWHHRSFLRVNTADIL